MNKLQFQYVVYAYSLSRDCELGEEGTVVYVGIGKDTGDERHANHLKHSKALDHGGEESFNFWLQTNTDLWDYNVLVEVYARDYEDAKAAATSVETQMIDTYKPHFNKLKVNYLKEII